jgi:hypothetical protein
LRSDVSRILKPRSDPTQSSCHFRNLSRSALRKAVHNFGLPWPIRSAFLVLVQRGKNQLPKNKICVSRGGSTKLKFMILRQAPSCANKFQKFNNATETAPYFKVVHAAAIPRAKAEAAPKLPPTLLSTPSDPIGRLAQPWVAPFRVLRASVWIRCLF